MGVFARDGKMKTAIALILLIASSAAFAAPERWYQDKYCTGHKEYVLDDKTRVDCLTDTHAIEYDFGYKWAECSGQGTYYAVKTRKLPGCVLIKEPGKYKTEHLIRLILSTPPWFGIWLADDNKIIEIRRTIGVFKNGKSPSRTPSKPVRDSPAI
jgi:hypothetical protein